MFRNEREWVEVYQGLDALWFHNGNPATPHAELASGKHSDGFFNSRLVIPDYNLLGQAASDLVEKLASSGRINLSMVDVVVGPQTGATKLAMFVAESISARSGKFCSFASPEKVEVGGVKSMRFSLLEAEMLPRRKILLVDDVNTTGGSADLAAKAAVACGGTVFNNVLVLVNRSGQEHAMGRKVISLINRRLSMWEPSECPLCKQGSKAIKPKDNWAQLTAG
jgi:orotate phosphoribosyltransferase